MRALQVAANTVSLAKFALPLMQALRAEGWEVDALGGPDGHEGELERAGFPVHPWPMGHSLNPLVILKARRALRGFLQSRRYDVIHSHCSFGGIVANPVASPWTRNLFYTQHGFFVHEGLSSISRRAWLEIEKVGLRSAHTVICVSQAESDLAASLGVGPAGKFVRIPGAGVHTAQFSLEGQERAARREALRAEWGIDVGTPVVLTVSRLTWDKGYREMIQATDCLKRLGMAFRLVVAGSGKDEARIRAAIERAGLEREFMLLGWRDDVVDLYAAADVFLFASHREGLPISPIEAMASGLPVISSDIPGCREELAGGQYGVLYPTGDARSLADSLGRLLRDEGLRQRLAQAGPRRAAAFDLQHVIGRQVQLYNQAAAQP